MTTPQREIFRPVPTGPLSFIYDEWSDWEIHFLWWPVWLKDGWHWLEECERRTCKYATEYRFTKS